jgi:nitrate/nitrite transporter NarK
VALLLIILALFAFLGIGSGSSTTSHAEAQRSQRPLATGCVVVTWQAGGVSHQRPCHQAPAKP